MLNMPWITSMCHRDETHLWKKLSTVAFAHESFGSTSAVRHPSVICFFLSQARIIAPSTCECPSSNPCRKSCTALCTPKDSTPGSVSQMSLSTLSTWPLDKLCGSLLWGTMAVPIELLGNVVNEGLRPCTLLLSECCSYGQVWSQCTDMGWSAVGCTVLAAWSRIIKS